MKILKNVNSYTTIGSLNDLQIENSFRSFNKNYNYIDTDSLFNIIIIDAKSFILGLDVFNLNSKITIQHILEFSNTKTKYHLIDIVNLY